MPIANVVSERQGELAELCRKHQVWRPEVSGPTAEKNLEKASNHLEMPV